MTNDFKDKILKWLTGNYETQTGIDEPQFGIVETIANNLYDYMIDEVGGTGQFFITSIVQGKNATNQNLDFIAISGQSYNDKYANPYGFILIVDNNFNPIQLITRFSSGTIIGAIEIMSVGDDGNFYGIETAYGTTTRRFIMLNNVAIKLPAEQYYRAILRKSYNLPANISSADYYNALIKAPGQSKFLITGSILEDYLPQPIATELTVNVGSSNNWVEYRYTGVFTGNGVAVTDTWASWDSSGNLDFKIIGFNSDAFCEYYKNNSSISVTTYTIPYDSDTFYPFQFSSVIINTDLAYIGVYGNDVEEEVDITYLFYADMNLNKLTQINRFNISQVDAETLNSIQLMKSGTNIYFELIGAQNTAGTYYGYYIGRIIEKQVYYKLVNFVPIAEMSLLSLFNVTNNFNLYNYYVQSKNTCYKIKEIYNSLNYNGLPYQALNSMVPNSVNIYDPNGVVIFARNLYNRIVNNNTTIATVEVPNDFMNNVTIQLKELISQTNNVMVSDITEIAKNIYEELLINFVNSIIVKNSNNINNVVINNTASNRINNSVSNPSVLDYNNSKIGKYKINYANDTSVINPIDFNLTYTGLSTNYIMCVYVPIDYAITNIQLLSNDETTVYQTIDCSNLENNKYYTINQKMEVV